jgi:signal transduction histidine kinase
MAASAQTAEGDRASVLVVDDTPANLVAVGAVLGPLGVRVVEARSGPEALEHLSREPFAVVLLDVQMPTMDGFEVARRLRETPMGAEVPIIFLTAIHRDEQYARKGYASGAADYITKPYEPEVLRARVRAFVDLFHQRERLRVQQVGERTRERDDALAKLAALLESERVARHEAETASRAKDEFLATMSHELRTPLNAILGWASIARRHSTSPEAERALATIERNARAQMRIIEDVLDLGRTLQANLRLRLSDMRVADAIEGALQALRPDAAAKGVKLAAWVDSAVGSIVADAERFQQIVLNLVSNAIKFTPQGGHVEVRATRAGSSVTIQIRDDGQGIRREFVPHVFEAFRQADSSTARRHGGLGLGLAIVHQLVRAHGGTVAVDSEGDGKGATFTIVMPDGETYVAPDEGSHASDSEPAISSAEAAASLRGVRLLVVDDDEDSRDFLACLLEEGGAVVCSASSAAEALQLLRQNPPDVLVSDIGMPDVDGYALIKQIRSMPRSDGGQTPAIALTAYARSSDGERARAAGFQAHVTKPVDPQKLAGVIADLARLSHL